MTIDWTSIVLDSQTPNEAWARLFKGLFDLATTTASPVEFHNLTVIPDRLLSECAWKLWEAFPASSVQTAKALIEWHNAHSASGKAILILDALSLRELSLLIGAAETRKIPISAIRVTASECPSTTDQFAKALRLPSRSALSNNGKPAGFLLGSRNIFTDVTAAPFADCRFEPSPDLIIWHTWLDNLIHVQKKSPDQVFDLASRQFKGDDFWEFVNRLRKGRSLVITSDHGYAVSKWFSSEIQDKNAITALKGTFGASRYVQADKTWEERFMPPLVLTHNKQNMIMGQWKWPASGGFPQICHGGLSLLEVAVPFIEFPAL